MENLKIRVNSADESNEAQELFFELGYEKGACSLGSYPAIIVTTKSWSTENYCSTRALGLNNHTHENHKETTLPELRAMANQDQDEPFLTPECTLNDQYAEIEQVRQSTKDNVNHPGHYADSAIECIDAMEAMMTHEQFIGYLRGNLFKYQWRYEKKNGIEDLKKAQWYLEKLTVKVTEKNAPF